MDFLTFHLTARLPVFLRRQKSRTAQLQQLITLAASSDSTNATITISIFRNVLLTRFRVILGLGNLSALN